MSEKDFWQGYVPDSDKRQQALDKKAENARELGLDYEPAQQEPVACKHEWFRTGAMETGQCRCIKCGAWNTSLPVQRTWVGLSNEEIYKIYRDCGDLNVKINIAQAIEAKLKEKNT